jgi:hypothetical protein
MIVNLDQLRDIAEIEFADIVTDVVFTDINELRIMFIDGSFLDVWRSLKLEGRYSYHWERRFVDGSIYRHDNAPHMRWENVPTYPKHFHNGTEDNVIPSDIANDPALGLRQVLSFAKEIIVRDKGES